MRLAQDDVSSLCPSFAAASKHLSGKAWALASGGNSRGTWELSAYVPL